MLSDDLETFLFSSYIIDEIVKRSIINVEYINDESKNVIIKKPTFRRGVRFLDAEYIDIECACDNFERSKSWNTYSLSNAMKLSPRSYHKSYDDITYHETLVKDIEDSDYNFTVYLRSYINKYFNKYLSILKTEYGEEIVGAFIATIFLIPNHIYHMVKYLEELEWKNLKRYRYEIRWTNMATDKEEETHLNVELRNLNGTIECSLYGTFHNGRMIRFDTGYQYVRRWILHFANDL
uniref:Fam-a protein n=1 Tax=Strongyloides papillosus TaxID=174720 RepID=A0A0N5BTC1_STREA